MRSTRRAIPPRSVPEEAASTIFLANKREAVPNRSPNNDLSRPYRDRLLFWTPFLGRTRARSGSCHHCPVSDALISNLDRIAHVDETGRR